ncbi:hypothetical protein ACFPRL_30025 [Pseudoclavibacter helvolus]
MRYGSPCAGTMRSQSASSRRNRRTSVPVLNAHSAPPWKTRKAEVRSWPSVGAGPSVVIVAPVLYNGDQLRQGFQ